MSAGKTSKTAPRRARKPAPAISLRVEEPEWRKDAAALRLIRRAARAGLAAAPGAFAGLTILLTGDKAVQALNAQFRGKNKPTNVLSFPGSEDDGYLGDVAMAYGVVRREAKAQKKRFSEHAAHLALHGVLHLLGHDHQRAKDETRMEALEILILERLGIGDPYAPRPYTKSRKAVH